MITLQEMSAFNYLIWFISGLVDLKNQLWLISYFLLLFLMHHIATHNIGFGSYNDDFKWLAFSQLNCLC